MRSPCFALVLAVLLLGIPLRPLLAQDTAPPVTPAPPAHGMMQSCEHHQAIEAALARMAKLAADTKSSKDVTTLQSALNQVGVEVTKMQEAGMKCSAMMDTMDRMKSPASGVAAQPHKH